MTPPTQRWWQMVINGTISLSEISPVLSRLYAFDYFIHNTDRHGGNFLLRDQRNGYALLAFDWSKAWIVNDFPLPHVDAMVASSTTRVHGQLKNLIGEYINTVEARSFLNKIRSIPVNNIDNIIHQHPYNWLTNRQRSDIRSWWSSVDFNNRIDVIIQGIENGTYT